MIYPFYLVFFYWQLKLAFSSCPQSTLFAAGCAFPVFGETKGWWFYLGIVSICIMVHKFSVKISNLIDISLPYAFWFSIPQGQRFIPTMMLLIELLINLGWMIQRKFGLHLIIAILSNLNLNPLNIEEWSIFWTCSFITIRSMFFVSFGHAHGFSVANLYWNSC